MTPAALSEPELLLGPLLSAVVVGFISWIAVRVSVAKLEQRLDDKDENDRRRFEQLEGYIGLSNGNGSVFVRKGECGLRHEALEGLVVQAREDVTRLRQDTDERLKQVHGRISKLEQR